MKKLTSLFLVVGLIIVSASVALAQSSSNQQTATAISSFVEPASTSRYFDTSKQYPVLGSSGVYIAYQAAQLDNKYLFYLMITESVRGDKCYGTGQDSTIITMYDMKSTGHVQCETGSGAGYSVPTGPAEQNLWSGWTQIDASPLPTNMTVSQ